MLRRLALLVVLAALAPMPGSAAAQPVAAAAATVDGRAVATEVRRLLNEHYVLPELRSKFAAVLDKGISSGRYDGAERNHYFRED